MTVDDEERIKSELQRSMNVLELNNDLETSRSIYENVSDEPVDCVVPLVIVTAISAEFPDEGNTGFI
jgi:S-adenosylmethionine synthetase